MTWIGAAGWIALGLGAVGALAFAIASLREREIRALFVTLALAVLVLTALLVPLLVEFAGRDVVLLIELGTGLLVLLLVVLPIGRRRSARIVGEQTRVDERDAVFHRFYRIEPGSREFESYYRDHPEKKEHDEQVRSMPALAAPGSKTFHPLTSPFQAATFGLIEEIVRHIEREPESMEGKPVDVSPEEAAGRIKGFARHLGADLVGCTRLNPAYVYSHIGRGPGVFGAPIELDHTHAVVVGVEMSREMVRLAPDSPTTTETAIRYLEAAKVALLVARYIHLLGYEARAHVDTNYRVMCVPVAVDAGLGELGRLGLLVTPRYGPRVRLSVVSTTLVLAQDEPVTFGVQEFCAMCKKCATHCPSASVDSGDKGVYAGAEKWRSRQDGCYRAWRIMGSDCALCQKVCPYSHPGTFPHNLARFLVRQNPLARRLMLWGDDLFYGHRVRTRATPPSWHRTGRTPSE